MPETRPLPGPPAGGPSAAAGAAPALLAVLLLAGCTGLGPTASGDRARPALSPGIENALERVGGARGGGAPAEAREAAREAAATETEPAEDDPSVVYPGTGRFVQQPDAEQVGRAEAGEIVLNFENADLREVIKVVLQDTLGVNYLLDPGVQGTVTIQTSRPLAERDLLPTLETILAMNGAALIERDGSYRIVPLAKAGKSAGSPRIGRRPLPPGYGVRVVPLEYIGAPEMAGILAPVAAEGSVVRVDALRNLLVLAGTSADLRALVDTIDTFDVDWMAGLSVGFFSLEHADAAQVAAQIETIVGAGPATPGKPQGAGASPPGQEGGEAPLRGLVRVVPVDSANGLLVVTPQAEYLKTVRTWVKRLDVLGAHADDGRNFYVYRVKSGEAAALAGLLGQLFGGAGAPAAAPPAARVAPGQQPVTAAAPAARGAAPRPPAAAAAGAVIPGQGASPPVGIVADTERNSLLIMATPLQHEKIVDALDKLDIMPLQVLIEATIIEVTLRGELQYGLQWFFESRTGDVRGTGSLDGTLDSSGSSGLGNIFPGFNFSLVTDAEDIRAVFSAFAEDSLVEVLSSPSVMVLDNRAARIQVGDQVPIVTQQQQNVVGESNIINSIQYRDTGIVLEVVPRVTPGGLVTMEVDQEVSDVVATSSSSLDSPTFTTRRITSSVAVSDGEAVVLGGLIEGRRNRSNGGVPGLRSLPGLGVLFGQRASTDDRTELVVILEPRVIGSSADARRVAEDFRNRMQELKGGF